MIVYVQVAATFHFEVEETMPGKQFQHVIQKRDAGIDARLPATVKQK
jgi:hypothetical protein